MCRRIRRIASEHPILIVAVTGWGQDEDKRRAIDAGFDCHLMKPVDPVALTDLLVSRQRAADRSKNDLPLETH